jgi:outer membrane protein assembly factor BamB
MRSQTRRRFVRLVGAGAIAGLAGCSGDGSDGDAGETTGEPGTSTRPPTESPGDGETDTETPTEDGSTDVSAWPTVRADRRNTGHDPAATGPAEEPSVLWERAGFGESYPAVVDDTVYVGGPESVRALDADSGETLWTYEVGARVDATPAVVDGTVVFPSWNGEIHAVSAGDGSEVWVRSESSVSGEPLDGDRMALETGAVTVADGTVYNGSVRRRKDSFFAFDLATGDTQFVIDSTPDDGDDAWESGNETFVSAPAVTGGRAFLGGESGYHYAIDLASGEVAWEHDAGFGFRGSSTVVDGTVYYATSGRAGDTPTLYATDASSGEVQWRYEVGPSDGNQEVRAATAFAHGVVLVPHTGGQLHAVEPDGTERWTTDLPASAFAGASADSERIYLGMFGGVGVAIDPETGDVIWEVRDLGGDVDTPPIVNGDTIYFNAERGPLTALRA